MKCILIGINGKMGSGKSTVSKIITDKANEEDYQAWQVNFGALLKNEVSKIYGISIQDCYTQEGKETLYDLLEIYDHINDCKLLYRLINPQWHFVRDGHEGGLVKVREILQWYGTNLIRKENPDHWVDSLRRKCAPLFTQPKTVVIIDDLRFKNELQFINNRGGVSVRIETYEEWQAGSNADHQSETDLDDCLDQFSIVLKPDFGLQALEEQVANLVWGLAIKDR